MLIDMPHAPSPITTPLRTDSRDPAGALTAVQSRDLLKGKKFVVIEHNGANYRLQTTKLGKLILTK